MNELQDLQDKLFLDIQNIIQDLSDINSLDRLLQDDHLIKELAEKTAFLKLSQTFDLKNLINFKEIETQPAVILEEEILPIVEDSSVDNLNIDTESEPIIIEETEATTKSYEEISSIENLTEDGLENEEEELASENDNLDLSDNEMFKDDTEEEIIVESHSSITELTQETQEILQEEQLITHSFEKNEESQFSFAMEKQPTESEVVEVTKEQFISEISISEHNNSTAEDRISEKEKAFLESESRRLQIIEDNKKATISDIDSPIEESDSKIIDDASAAEKKIKLANIKGIHKSLFDEELLGNLQEEEKKSDSGSLLSNNRPTNYMEAAKPKQEFRLDLNDKIAFTQHLFNNSQMDLNHVINRLNSFDNLEEAKEFLSDLYYERNWEKVDRFAQRLWILVENKFL